MLPSSSSSNMGVVVVELYSADNLTTPSEQKLRSGPTIVGELERESRGDRGGREVRLDVIGSRALTGDPASDVMEASSDVSDDILAGEGIGTPDILVGVDAEVAVGF